ncbi:hypothetical protein QML40_10805, partial [Aerococcus urinaeequi]
ERVYGLSWCSLFCYCNENGAGSAGTAIAKKMIHAGATNVVVCDIDGAISEDDPELQDRHKELASISNPDHLVAPKARH